MLHFTDIWGYVFYKQLKGVNYPYFLTPTCFNVFLETTGLEDHQPYIYIYNSIYIIHSIYSVTHNKLHCNIYII